MKSFESNLLKELAWPLATLGILSLLFFVVILPKIFEIFKLKSEMVIQNEEIIQLKQKLSDLQTLSDADLTASSELLLEALPPQKDFYKYSYSLHKLFEKNNVTMTDLSLSLGVKEEVVTTSPLALLFNIDFTGTFTDLKNLIKDIDQSLPLFALDSIRFNSVSASESATLPFEGKMAVKSFYLPLPKTLGNASKSLPKISNQDQKLIEDLGSYNRYKPETSSGESGSVIIGREDPFSF